jgi:hypothetical protein
MEHGYLPAAAMGRGVVTGSTEMYGWSREPRGFALGVGPAQQSIERRVWDIWDASTARQRRGVSGVVIKCAARAVVVRHDSHSQATTSLIFLWCSIAMLQWNEGDSLWGYEGIRNITSAVGEGQMNSSCRAGPAGAKGQKYMHRQRWGRPWAGRGLEKGDVRNDE